MLDVNKFLVNTGDAEVDYYLSHLKAASDADDLNIGDPDVQKLFGL
jgi:hypothetical protein